MNEDEFDPDLALVIWQFIKKQSLETLYSMWVHIAEMKRKNSSGNQEDTLIVNLQPFVELALVEIFTEDPKLNDGNDSLSPNCLIQIGVHLEKLRAESANSNSKTKCGDSLFREIVNEVGRNPKKIAKAYEKRTGNSISSRTIWRKFKKIGTNSDK